MSRNRKRLALNLSPDVAALNPELAGASDLRLPGGAHADARLPGEPKFRSQTERRAWHEWAQGQGARRVLYEPLILRLSGGNYKPDFVLEFAGECRLWFVEVKGSWDAFQSGRPARRAIKEAAAAFGWLGRFFALTPADGGGWAIEEFEA